LDGGEVVGRAVMRIAEAEIGGGQSARRVLVDGDGVVGAVRGVVHTGDVEGDGVGRLVEIDAAIGGGAVVLHLEGEGGIAGAVGVGRRGEHQLAGGDVADRDELPIGDGNAIELERAGGGGGGDLDGGEVVGRAVMRIAEAEIGGGQSARRVLVDGDGVVGAVRGVVHT